MLTSMQIQGMSMTSALSWAATNSAPTSTPANSIRPYIRPTPLPIRTQPKQSSQPNERAGYVSSRIKTVSSTGEPRCALRMAARSSSPACRETTSNGMGGSEHVRKASAVATRAHRRSCVTRSGRSSLSDTTTTPAAPPAAACHALRAMDTCWRSPLSMSTRAPCSKVGPHGLSPAGFETSSTRRPRNWLPLHLRFHTAGADNRLPKL
mmetsp:Transcript_37080/g.81043  ORF Transcript_37080/g.81043 Transcript_37080/m.81043 type:complete len:208 (+) Transcript_37080:546-1169(+)